MKRKVNPRKEAAINGVEPRTGMYLVHRGRQKTYGQVVEVRAPRFTPTGRQTHWTRVVWRSRKTGAPVTSDPIQLRERGYEWSYEPLDDVEAS